MTDRAKRDGTWDTVQDRSIPAERYAEFELLIAASPKAPEYNNVDATLWYFDAIRACHEATGDIALLRDLFPVLADIVDWHVRGTRYQIRVDPKGGLLYAGEPGGQLTWMDAKVDGWVTTPRIGKQAEVSALWYNALCVMVEFARLLESDGQVDESYGRRSPDRDHAASVGDLRRAAETYEALAEQARAGFALFWNEKTGYCCDVLDGPDGNDPALRRNQLFAVSLPNAPRGCIAQAWSVAEVLRVWREIGWTTGGLPPQAPGRPAGGIRDVD